MERKNKLTGRLKYRDGLQVKPVEEVSDISLREFFEEQQYSWESDHGSVPMPTNDAFEQNLPIEEKSKDIGFGHKITTKEMEAGLIHGIPFINKETGEFINLTEKDKRFIKKQDNLTLVARARAEGWDKKLQERGLSWETIPDKYKLPLEDIAFNVKDPQQWNKIFDEIKNDNVAGFVKELRRKDAGKNTAGMDNRAAKAAAASGLITSYEQALDYGLELTTERRLPFLSKIFERQQYGLGGLTKLFTKMVQRQIKKSRQAVKNNPTASTNSALELDEKLNNLFRKFGDQEYIDEGMPSLENLKQDNQAGFYFSKTNSGNYRLSEIEYDEFNNPKKLKHTIYKINKNLANEEDVNREVVRLGLDVGEKLGYIPQEIFPENMLYDYVPKELHKIYGLE
tara:strand:- start:52 stop:1242 length:1191 start_codon:yes stop_codon:yes gene_type:complete